MVVVRHNIAYLMTIPFQFKRHPRQFENDRNNQCVPDKYILHNITTVWAVLIRECFAGATLEIQPKNSE